MKNIFEKNKIEINDKQLQMFENYRDLLLFYNKKFNITAITNPTDIYIKHFIDSIYAVDKLSTNAKIIEIGSGGGFPSIPLKIMREDLSFTLVESTLKKCNFLNIVIKELNLSNVNVICERAEVLARNNDYRQQFDFVTARAVARLNTLCEYCLPFIKVGGKFVAYKGIVENEVSESQNAIKLLGGKLSLVENYKLVENDDNRSIVVIDKITDTNDKYPRGNGKERSKPL